MTTYKCSVLYILTTPDMPGIVKVGYTDQSVGVRAGQISKKPFFKTRRPFEVWYQVPVENPVAAEKHAHRILDCHRLPTGKHCELFMVSPEEARDALLVAARAYPPRLRVVGGYVLQINRNTHNQRRRKSRRKSIVDKYARQAAADIAAGKLAAINDATLEAYSTSPGTRQKIKNQLIEQGIITRQENGRCVIAA